MLSSVFLASTALLATRTLAWNRSNGTDFKPCSGELNWNQSATVSDEVFQRLAVNRGYLDRLIYLASQNNTDLWKFNFNPQLPSSHASYGAGGVAILANRATAPAVIGTGVSMALGFLEPCGINTMHYHPSATQLVSVVSGGPLEVGAIWDNAATGEQLKTTVHTWEMVTLPQGSIHWEYNPTCDTVVTANAFNTDDPGIFNVANALFKMDSSVLNGVLNYPEGINGMSLEDFGKQIPPSYALGAEECLKRCGINKDALGTPDS